jgi:hypothetical protein
MMLLHSVYLFKISVYAFSGVLRRAWFFQVPDMCKTANAIHRAKAEQDLTNREIANRMGAALGKSIDESLVQKYFSGGAGVPMESIGSLLSAMGFKLVKQDEEVIDSDELESIVLWAEKGIKAWRTMRHSS